VFVLACFVGYMVVWNVTPALHTPLMSVTNAISSIIIIGALVQIAPPVVASVAARARPDTHHPLAAVVGIALTAINMFGGFAVTQRMLSMFRNRRRCHVRKPGHVSYIAATSCFILSSAALAIRRRRARQSLRNDRHGDRRAGDRCSAARRPGGIAWIVGALAVGAAIGLYLARTVQMTQMPELVAFMHSLVGLVAMVVGYASYIDPTRIAGMSPAETRSITSRSTSAC
jgi:hypothetical protein